MDISVSSEEEDRRMVFNVSSETRGMNYELNADVGVSRGAKVDCTNKCDGLYGDRVLVVFKDNRRVQNSTPNVQLKLLKSNEFCMNPRDSMSPVVCHRLVDISYHMLACVASEENMELTKKYSCNWDLSHH